MSDLAYEQNELDLL